MNILSFVAPIVDILKGTGIIKDPETEAKLKIALIENQSVLEAQMTEQMKTINETMKSEAQSEHWAQWLWRPAVGFTFCLTIVNNYVFIPYLSIYGLKPIDIPGEVWSAMLVVLGASAATRGLEKWSKAKSQLKE